jgi:hypothetical protein
MGISEIKQINKNNQEFRMIRATCNNEEDTIKLIKEGVKLDYFKLIVEEYKRPIRPLQCYKCQQFDHVAANCIADQVCQRCGGVHPKTECMSEKEKCANCGEEHESSYHQCAFYRNKLEERINKINSNNGLTGSISQRVNSSQTDMQKQIIESMKTMIENTPKFANK